MTPRATDGEDDWTETLFAAYRDNIAGAQQNLREHCDYPTLVGQERDFTIRCNC